MLSISSTNKRTFLSQIFCILLRLFCFILIRGIFFPLPETFFKIINCFIINFRSYLMVSLISTLHLVLECFLIFVSYLCGVANFFTNFPFFQPSHLFIFLIYLFNSLLFFFLLLSFVNQIIKLI
jgi:hypothetical protein